MKRTHSFVLMMTVLAGTLFLSGCSTNSIVANAAKAAFEDRLLEQQITDAKISTGIAQRLIDIDKMLIVDLNVDVWKARVMISGTMSDANKHNLVARAVQKDSRIKAFYDDVMIVTKDVQKQRRAWKEKAQDGAQKAAEVFGDFWIETKISAQLIATKGINSVNYRWRSVLGTIYIIGEARNAEEWRAVQSVIKGIDGVKSLKPHVLIFG